MGAWQTAEVIALKCPSCGAGVERETMKCRYCGSELVLLPDGSSSKFRFEMLCPKCGAINEKSSWYCSNCKTILTKDIEMLRELKKKIAFEQEKIKTPWMRENLEPGEYIYYVFTFKDGDFYAVTEKRLIKKKKGQFEQAQLTDVVGFGAISTTYEGLLKIVSKTSFEMDTFQGKIVFDDFSASECLLMVPFRSSIREALSNHNLRKKHVNSVILSLPLGDEVGQKGVQSNQTSTRARSELGFCPYCGTSHVKDSQFCSKCGGKLTT